MNIVTKTFKFMLNEVINFCLRSGAARLYGNVGFAVTLRPL